MTSADIRDIIKLENSLKISKFFCGKIDEKYEKAICVYNLQNEVRQNIAVGGKSLTTQKKKFSILIRWNKNYTETEEAAKELYEYLTNLKQISYNNIDIKYTEMITDEPIDLHCGDDGIFERLIDIVVHFEEN